VDEGTTPSGHDVVVVGASAGGVQAVSTLLAGLPRHFDAAIFVTLHLGDRPSMLDHVLQRATELPVTFAVDGGSIRCGEVYVAPPDHHLLFTEDHVVLGRGPRENGDRPSIDAMFRSAAHTFGPRVVGVVLTGASQDGTLGLHEVTRSGGIGLVQDPDDALVTRMPQSAAEQDAPDEVLPLEDLPAALREAVAAPPAPRTPVGEGHLDRLARLAPGSLHPPDGAEPSRFSCPECGGVLWEQPAEGGAESFRCRVGHSYLGHDLAIHQAAVVETALWTAVRALEENVEVLRRMQRRSEPGAHPAVAERFGRRAEDAQQSVEILREHLLGRGRGRVPQADGATSAEPDGSVR
jgi:two-component system chemotaxis response regulator CheB